MSLMSAESVMKALDPAKYEVIPIGITKDGRWLVGDDPLAALKEGAKERLAQMVPAAFLADPAGPGLVAVGGRPPAELAERLAFDVVFPVLHGPNGRTAPSGPLGAGGVPYVGSGVAGSAVGMDKR